MFVTAVWVVTVATTASVADAPFAMLPTVHTPAAYDPVEGVADTSVKPAGSASATDTPLAASGPLLVTATLKVTLLFNVGVALLTVFVTTRLACRPLTVARVVLLAGVGS